MAKRKGNKRAGSRQPEAITMLIEDHQKVQKMFKTFERTEDQQEQEQLATQICNELTVHAQLEEQVFYPAAREALEEADLIDEAAVEHQVAKDLIEKIKQSRPHDEEYCALVTVLGEYVNHHIEEEQKELFPQLKKAEIDFEALGEEMTQKKQELMSELGLAEGEETPMEGAMTRRQQRSQASRSRAANR
jgi:hemerythrin-like domain-containing protein